MDILGNLSDTWSRFIVSYQFKQFNFFQKELAYTPLD
jgi:hypothetical protein